MTLHVILHMTDDSRRLALMKQRLDEAERSIQYVRQALEEGLQETKELGQEPKHSGQPQGERVVEGVFDGRNMTGNDGQEYPVPPNYASKSKLVEGDILKLTIGADGSFIYKQIRPVERKRLIGTLVIDEGGTFRIKAEGKLYNVLLASITFYQISEGDEVAILVPSQAQAEWGAVEHVIRS